MKRIEIKKILIANRGEIALRIQRTARKMGIATVALYSQADANAAFVKNADDAVLLEGNQLSETYLNIERIIAIAKAKNVNAIHPGYGFLSENEKFIAACEAANIIFIGPGKNAVHAMGNKIEARATAVAAGVPVTPGITGTPKELAAKYATIGFPILIKAAAGGGGKGMKVVTHEADLDVALESTAREAKNYFGDDAVYMEKYIAHPRHIEVQILGDQHGNVVHLFERECSIQRRHQKIIEEAPSPTLTPDVREKICTAGVQLAKSIGYYSAGTMEFLLDADMEFYFLEMNTRIQVEHPVTELTTGIDIVEQQIKIAQGEALSFTQKDVQQNGHAIECRIYAEDPTKNFIPSPGKIIFYSEPKMNGVRIDGMELCSGDTVSGDFDPMISKLVTWGNNREAARQLMLQALEHYTIAGIQTNIDFLHGFLQHTDFVENRISTKYMDEQLATVIGQIQQQKDAIDITPVMAAGLLTSFLPATENIKNVWQQIGYWRQLPIVPVRLDGKDYTVALQSLQYPAISFTMHDSACNARIKKNSEAGYSIICNEKEYHLFVSRIDTASYIIRYNGHSFPLRRLDILNEQEKYEASQDDSNTSGTITTPMPGKIIKVAVTQGQIVKKGDVLIIVEAMKMENTITSPMDAIVEEIIVQEQQKVGSRQVLIQLKTANK